MAEDKGWSDGKKWALGIVASLIVAVGSLVLGREGGPLKPRPTTTTTARPAAVVVISRFDLPFILPSRENAVVKFSVSNEGTATARRCALRGDVSPVGDEFFVEPGATAEVSWAVRSYGKKGSVTFSAWVTCENARSPMATAKTEVF